MFAALTSALTFINAESAVVKGMITDNSTHEPLIGATVKTDSGEKGTATDAYGRFSLNLAPGRHHITVSYIGYSDTTAVPCPARRPIPAPFTSAKFSNITLIGPMTAKNAGFSNTSDYFTAGSMFPDNGSKFGKFQAAVQIRRSSKLNISNLLAIGYPVGLIVDGEKGSTVAYAKAGEFALANCIFSAMGVVGTDKNKEYEDYLYDYLTKSEDRSQVSFSHSFFLAGSGNRLMEENALNLSDPAFTGQNYCPASELSDGKGGYIGAFRDASDNWMKGWTNFDPQNTIY